MMLANSTKPIDKQKIHEELKETLINMIFWNTRWVLHENLHKTYNKQFYKNMHPEFMAHFWK
jgi:serine protease inhibitor